MPFGDWAFLGSRLDEEAQCPLLKVAYGMIWPQYWTFFVFSPGLGNICKVLCLVWDGLFYVNIHITQEYQRAHVCEVFSVKSCDIYCNNVVFRIILISLSFSLVVSQENSNSKESSYFTISVWRVFFFFFLQLQRQVSFVEESCVVQSEFTTYQQMRHISLSYITMGCLLPFLDRRVLVV